ncbi:metabolite traffic protein EboE [Maribacter hydrothermalis]|uniref:Xylose isomerase n=1 Tax=Maribacter hydrothermalis TaxID=1836467 RepID=A0A1B7ZBN8_9FLAO|nr:metabolite traffic protein EboE [Maribacter hydrothermalis]APQ16296.1 xylose isomerase [Maribacter hydrothermalis]OBR40135.1 xylose isomerase [Maribacter hydrothermalis]
MQLKENLHLTYCTNIHPGQDWKSTFESIKKYVPGIKQEVSKEQPFGLGLRLSNKASEELDLGDNLSDFKKWLSDNNLYVFTMNGFPYGNFHDERVKDMVHAPDWTTDDRLKYTERLFRQLSELIPEGMNGGISTSPITYKYWHKTDSETKNAFEVGAKNMLEVAKQLFEIEQTTETYLHLDIEPEPDGLLENSDEVLLFYSDYLVPLGIAYFKQELGLDPDAAEALIKKYITVCYDVCHFALAYEEPTDTFTKFKTNNIRVGKIQVSAALKILFNGTDDERIWEELSQFNEPTYLHQVTEKVSGKVKTYSDLPLVLESERNHKELRAHYHVPIFLEKYGKLFSTQDHILKTIDYIKSNPISEHLEIETYTWDVLPADLKEYLSISIIREIEWFKSHM